ncbi:MAG: hypothetical protein Q4D23_01405 [Bacteroidales bacterium]|nr:hypothetical protein [Bacteroidales bacterium]
MKKIYTLIALAFAAMSASADVVLTMGGQVCDPSKVVEVLAEEINYGDETDPYIMITNGQTDPKVYNNGTSAASFTVTVEAEEWKEFKWCGISTQCKGLEGPSETRNGNLAAGASTNLVLDVEFGGFDDDFNPIWGPACYKSVPATVTIKAGSKSTTYQLNFVYDQRSSCGVYPEGYDGINTVLSTQDNAPRYDLQGRRTDSTTSGLFIKGGRKYIK